MTENASYNWTVEQEHVLFHDTALLCARLHIYFGQIYKPKEQTRKYDMQSEFALHTCKHYNRTG